MLAVLFARPLIVATALTVYGIETGGAPGKAGGSLGGLQQHLPFTVLKRYL